MPLTRIQSGALDTSITVTNTVTANTFTGNVLTASTITSNAITTNAITAAFYIGDGSQLANVASVGPLSYNEDNVTSNITISSGQNAFSVGPIKIAANVSVTVPSNQRWIVI